MGKSLMIQGTMANVGKSILIAGLCRAFKQDGYKVAPFCAESMIYKTFVTAAGVEMNKMQALQAQAAGSVPDVNMNPILIKPVGQEKMQLFIAGERQGIVTEEEYFAQKDRIEKAVLEAYSELEKRYDIILAEGAGSPVEGGLSKYDMVNMGLATKIHAPVLLMGDMDCGGVMAQLLGTLSLFEEEEKRHVKGLLFNKFRGRRTELSEMQQTLEKRGGVPIFGILPYLYTSVDDEEKMSERYETEDNMNMVDIAVIKLPHISNYVDFNPFECVEEVSLHYASSPDEIGDADMIILPDTTDVTGDIRWLREKGMETRILQHARRDKIVLGICGGYRMLGHNIVDEEKENIHGLGLLPIDSYIPALENMPLEWNTAGCFSTIEGKLKRLSKLSFTECEMVPMNIERLQGQKSMLKLDTRDEGMQKGNVYGINAKSLFYNENVLMETVRSVLESKGMDGSSIQAYSLMEYKEAQFDILADIVRQYLNLDKLFEMIQTGV